MGYRSWSELSARAGRNDLPYILATSYYVNSNLHDDELPEAVAAAWTAAEWPEQLLDTTIWLHLFEASGFVSSIDGEAEPPAELTLYRGATAARALGLSWTDSLEQAEWFANRFTGLRDSVPAHVYSITATADELLAHFTGRNENEWVVDTSNFSDDPEDGDLTIVETFGETANTKEN